LGSGDGHFINEIELSDVSFSFFNTFLDNVSTSIPCISTYDMFSLYHEEYPLGTNVISSSVSIPSPSPPKQKAPPLKEQRSKPTLPSSSSHAPYSAEWICGRIHEDPTLALRALKRWTHKKRYREVNDTLIRELSFLAPDQALEAIKELKEPKLFVRGTRGRKLSLKVGLATLGALEQYPADALVDSGCEGSCIDIKYIRERNIPTRRLPRPIPVFNADGQPNQDGPIEEMVSLTLTINDHTERIDLGVTNLGRGQLFLGHDWLKFHNPSIDWQTGLLQFNRCPTSCGSIRTRRVSIDDDDDEDDQATPVTEDGDRLLLIDLNPAVELRAYQTKATQLAAEQAKTQPQKDFEELVPEYLHDYHDVFSPKDFDEIPPHRPWDHAIELLPDATDQLNCKVYPLSQDEQRQLDEFIDENLRTGRIQPSKSPMASPFFFVKKKDGKLRPVQDYRKLNEITIKNRYPLPLIGDLIDALSKAKYFTKLDV